jgi:hypothetical protein
MCLSITDGNNCGVKHAHRDNRGGHILSKIEQTAFIRCFKMKAFHNPAPIRGTLGKNKQQVKTKNAECQGIPTC